MSITRQIRINPLFRFIVIGLTAMLALAIGEAVAHPATVSGTIKFNGTPFNGTMTYQLNYPGSTGSYINLPVTSGPVQIANGTFNPLAIDGNDIQLPRGTYYAFNFYDQYGGHVTRLNYVITGSSFDLGAAVPTPVLNNNVNFLDHLCLSNVSVQNLTIYNNLMFGAGTTIAPYGISNAENIMGIRFAQAFNIQNLSSTTCGLQEAEADLPSSGGLIVAQPGTCNLTTTFSITKPVTLIGYGGGGSTSSSFASFLSPTVLQASGMSTPLIAVTPATGSTLSGVHFRDLALTQTSGSQDLLQVGNATADPTAILRDVTLDNVSIHNSTYNGINVTGTVYGLHLTNTSLVKNGQDGLRVSIPTTEVATISLDDVQAQYNTGNGVYAESTATSSTIIARHSTLAHNTEAGFLIAGGTGHEVDSSSISSNAGYGVSVTSAVVSGVQALSLKDDTFTSNTTYDISNGSTAYVLLYPQVTQAPVTNGTLYYIRPTLPPAAPLNCLSVSCAGGSTYASGTTYTNGTGNALLEEVGMTATGSCTGADFTLVPVVAGGSRTGNDINNNCAGVASVTFRVAPGQTFSATATQIDGGSQPFSITSWFESILP